MTSLHAEDRKMLERFFDQFGCPSAGVDVIVPALGRPLREGGGVLELNAPCGMTYLQADQPRAADDELVRFLSADRAFVRSEGRVPLLLAARDEFQGRSSLRAKIEARFRERYPAGVVRELCSREGWTASLCDGSAAALLIWVGEESIRALGMPANLRPRVLYRWSRERLASRHPMLVSTTRNAGGVFISVSSFLSPVRRKAGARSAHV